MTLTEEWLECFQESKAKGEDLRQSAFWRLAVLAGPPLGINEDDFRVQKVLREIQAALE
jgi:hypothetical protein